MTDIQDILVSAFQGDFEHARISAHSPLRFLASEAHLKFTLGCLGLIAATVTLIAAGFRLFTL